MRATATTSQPAPESTRPAATKRSSSTPRLASVTEPSTYGKLRDSLRSLAAFNAKLRSDISSQSSAASPTECSL